MRTIVLLCWITLMGAEVTGHGGVAVLVGITSCGYLLGASLAAPRLQRAARAVLAADARGQGLPYAEAMRELAKLTDYDERADQ